MYDVRHTGSDQWTNVYPRDGPSLLDFAFEKWLVGDFLKVPVFWGSYLKKNSSDLVSQTRSIFLK